MAWVLEIHRHSRCPPKYCIERYKDRTVCPRSDYQILEYVLKLQAFPGTWGSTSCGRRGRAAGLEAEISLAAKAGTPATRLIDLLVTSPLHHVCNTTVNSEIVMIKCPSRIHISCVGRQWLSGAVCEQAFVYLQRQLIW